MGAVMERIRLTNWLDAERARLGQIEASAVRTLEIEALVDTGATTLILPADVADRLGLTVMEKAWATLADDSIVPTKRVGGIRLEILGRDMLTTAYVLPVGTTPLIGQIPLEELDLIVEPQTHVLRLNPKHPNGRIIDIRTVAA
jgi:clan AA aspartic protease